MNKKQGKHLLFVCFRPNELTSFSSLSFVVIWINHADFIFGNKVIYLSYSS